MSIWELIFNNSKSNDNTKHKNKNSVILNNKNIVYPKNTEQEEIEELYKEIRTGNTEKHSVSNKYADNVIKNNRDIQKHAVFISEKEKYKEMENNFNKLMQKGDNIFVKYDE